jgi:hypothetical protein
MPASWYLPDVHTSPLLNQCWRPSITILSCHVPHPATLLTIYSGGQTPSTNTNYVDRSQAPARSWTSKPTLTPAQPSALALPLVDGGVHGDSYLDGNRKVGTLDGQKLLASSSSLTPSSHPTLLAATSRFTVTTAGSSRAGGKAEAGIYPLTLSSARSTVHTRYIPSKANPADGPSRGIFPPTCHLLPAVPIPVELQSYITNYNSDLSATELCLRREGTTPKPLPKTPCEHANSADHLELDHDLKCRRQDLFAETEDW